MVILNPLSSVSFQTNEFEGLLPGQQEIEEITEIIESTYEQIHTDDFPRSTKPIGRLQQELSSAATGLSETTNEVISSVKNPANLPASSKQYSHSLQNLVDIGMEIISTTEVRFEIFDVLLFPLFVSSV
jgi:hypothetical protein